MEVTISTIDENHELTTLLEQSWLAEANEKIPNFWHINLDTRALFELGKSLDDLGYATVITMSYNLVAREDLPAIHLYRKG